MGSAIPGENPGVQLIVKEGEWVEAFQKLLRLLAAKDSKFP